MRFWTGLQKLSGKILFIHIMSKILIITWQPSDMFFNPMKAI